MSRLAWVDVKRGTWSARATLDKFYVDSDHEALFVALVCRLGVKRSRTLLERTRRSLESPTPPKSPKKSGRPKQRRGFAAMKPKLASEISSMGGRAAHAAGKAHRYTKEEAAAAGRKGGFATAKRRKTEHG